MPFSLGFWAVAGAGNGGGAAAFEQISTTILTGNSSGVTFSSIPSTYKHLQIRITGRTDAGGSTEDNSGLIELNGDTTNGNYAGHYLSGNGSGVNSSSTSFKIGTIRNIATSLNTSSAFSAHIIDVLDYTSTNKNKTVRSLSGQHNATYSAYGVAVTSMLWLNTSAITSVSLKPAAGQNWVSGSRFTLYGIKG